MCLEREKDFEERVSKEENLRDVQHINIRFLTKYRTSSHYFSSKVLRNPSNSNKHVLPGYYIL